jgi:N-acetylmuramoyl-L-alanine amidase
VIDPGHGGSDSGARAGGAREDAATYRMAATLAECLHTRGATVDYTVDSAALDAPLEGPLRVPLDARLRFNGQPVRLRASGSPQDLWRRAALVQRLPQAQRVVFVSLHADKLSNSAWFGARVYFDRRSGGPCPLALIVKRLLTERGFTYTRGGFPIPREYGVLNPAYNPAHQKVLVEFATLSSPHDRGAIRSARWRRRMAETLADAIQECRCAPTGTL